MRLFMFAAAAFVIAAPAFAADNNAAAGKKLFDHYGCYQCHGYAAQGGAGARLAPDPKPYEAVTQFVRTTTGAMPAYSEKILPEADLKLIYAYLQSLPKAADVGKTPLLQSLAHGDGK